MITTIVYIIFLFLELFFAIGFSVYVIYLIYSSLKGSPYVPSKSKEVDFILSEAQLKKGHIFYDLGCGDGKVVRMAALRYGVKAIGIDINPILVNWAKLLAKMKKVENVEFRIENIFDTDLKAADVIYVFLMPALLKKLVPKFEKELKKSTLIISHGFTIEGWEKNLIRTIPHKPFPTYFYKIR